MEMPGPSLGVLFFPCPYANGERGDYRPCYMLHAMSSRIFLDMVDIGIIYLGMNDNEDG